MIKLFVSYLKIIIIKNTTRITYNTSFMQKNTIRSIYDDKSLIHPGGVYYEYVGESG